MMRVELTLKTVTPLFLGGADPRGEPELRAASIRGASRFWLRALLGAVIGNAPEKLDDLRKAESAVFGSTDTGASPVVMQVTGEDHAQAYCPLLHNPNKTFTFQGIMPGKTLTLIFRPRPPHRAISEAACGALLMFFLLGGLGKRSRRGFGSFVVCSAGEGFPMQLPDYSDAESFLKQLPLLIKSTVSTTESFVKTLGLNTGEPTNPPHFPVLHEQHAKVLFCKKPFVSWEEAMNSFWNVLRSKPFRDNRVFGFAGSAGRQASPLHLRIMKLGKAYHILLIAFYVQFADRQPSWGVMQNFLNEGKQKWNGEWAFGGSVTW
jgi:CRISPR-associated protein Cmr1